MHRAGDLIALLERAVPFMALALLTYFAAATEAGGYEAPDRCVVSGIAGVGIYAGVVAGPESG